MGLTALGGHALQEGDKQGVVLRSSRTGQPRRLFRPFLQGQRRCQSALRSFGTAIRIALTSAQKQSLRMPTASPAANTGNVLAESAHKTAGMTARFPLQRTEVPPTLRSHTARRRGIFDGLKGFSSITSGIYQ
ncbi:MULTISPECIES: hypothetical protein [unclassified Novosphingobium]|uniref:hypothetical protein n=1 Tax=unclassified Novosphingobium TaxID=2644732 RepID=UPI00146E56AE|nr:MULTISPECIES: hypothetical protein [unclassified Novosphingobium]NMN03822.1 hypothetical protein [Novosphingobium sp. SG919]NMN86188.1 hypothetical protein [Novosphingobium sp. SG916]